MSRSDASAIICRDQYLRYAKQAIVSQYICCLSAKYVCQAILVRLQQQVVGLLALTFIEHNILGINESILLFNCEEDNGEWYILLRLIILLVETLRRRPSPYGAPQTTFPTSASISSECTQASSQ
jgi:hypothetical protein